MAERARQARRGRVRRPASDVIAAEPYLAFPFGSRWLSALPAADLEALPVRPSLSTLLAALAALALVTFFATFLTSFRGEVRSDELSCSRSWSRS